MLRRPGPPGPAAGARTGRRRATRSTRAPRAPRANRTPPTRSGPRARCSRRSRSGRGAGARHRRHGQLRRRLPAGEQLLGLGVVADRVVVGDDPFEVDQQPVGRRERLHLPAAAHLAVGVVGERRLARVRLLPLLLVSQLRESGEQFLQRAVADHAARLGKGGVPAGLGRLGRRAALPGLESSACPPLSGLPVQPASTAARSAATPGPYAFRCTVQVLSTVDAGRCPPGPSSVPAGYSLAAGGAVRRQCVSHALPRTPVRYPFSSTLAPVLRYETSVVLPGE